ncbi:MAG: hypothetical protein KIT84_06350 [Labilithrix sp.]|nr:hypothetical protein [Labilithrix sp.]MCW5810613.1 hypothetical protein [Labilithrix sp.]
MMRSFFDSTGVATRNVSMFALGLTPVIAAYGVVELVAFIVPRLSRLRHANPEGRARLDRAALVLALVLATFQAWSMSKQLDALGASTSVLAPDGVVTAVGIAPTLTRMASLVGGVCISFLAAGFITRRGIANGVLLISLVEALGDATVRGLDELTHSMRWGSITPLQVLGGLVVLAVPIVATWLALQRSSSSPLSSSSSSSSSSSKTPYRDARSLALKPIVPIPASAIAPLPLASSILMLPAALSLFIGDLQPVQAYLERGDAFFTLVHLALVLGLGYLFARLLHRAREMADLVTRLGGAPRGEAESESRRALRQALPPTLLFLSAMVLTSAAAGALHMKLATPLVGALVVAVVMDARRAMLVARRSPAFVSIWQERRQSAVPVLRAALEADGVRTEVRGAHVLSLLQIFAPYAFAEVLVHADDAPRASAILRHLLLGEDAPARDERGAAVETDDGAPVEPARSASRALVGLVITALAPLAIVFAVASAAKSSSRPTHDGPRPSLAVVFVDDDVDVLDHVVDHDAPDIDIRIENAPVGPSRQERRTFAATKLRPGETPSTAIARMDSWLGRHPLPEGHRWGFELTEDYDPDTDRSTIDGVRTFVLRDGPPILTTDDITDAVASVDERSGVPEIYVAITLAPAGAERFAEATDAWRGRRLAIVLDGVINAAPIVRTRIDGGRLSVTMGAGDPEKRIAEARRLAGGLSGK